MGSVTVRGGLARIFVSAVVGAFLFGGTWAAVEVVHLATTPPDGDIFAGFAPIAGGCLGAFLGLFFGAAAGWCWLIVAVNREKNSRQSDAATRAAPPSDPSRTPPGS